jgi:aspartate--ammonia ligase
VQELYQVFKRTEFVVFQHYPMIKPKLPDAIHFVHTEELAERFPDLSPKEREREITKTHGAVFLIGIGGKLPNGEIHDHRAPDYDDWTTETENGFRGLNGDILFWNPILEDSFEISSMGIRVSPEILEKQLVLVNAEERRELPWHKRLLKGEFPQSIGGGIGQSRVCMFFLDKAHVGEVQSSIWPDEMLKQCKENGIALI